MRSIDTIAYKAIKAGSVKRVVYFSDNLKARPEPPYVVIKEESGDRRIVFRFYVHFLPGQQDTLDDYIFTELPTLISAPKNPTGYPIFMSAGAPDSTRNQDDQTISRSRAYFVPD
jgi:hypothetical protein